MSSFLLVLLVASIGCWIAMVLAWVADVWLPRVLRNRAKRLARRRDVVEMAQYRARRRMVGGGF